MNNTSSVQIDSLVTILRGARKGESFRVANLTETAVIDPSGTEHKRGNLRVDEGPLPVEVVELPEVVNIASRRPTVSRPRRRQNEDAQDLPECTCGCGLQVLKSSRSFRQGHDQRYRGQQLRRLATCEDMEQAEVIIGTLQRHWDYSRGELQERMTRLNEMMEENEAADQN